MDKEKPNLPQVMSGSARKPKPNGWWSMPGHEFNGSREGVLKAISVAKFLHLVDGKEVEEDIPQRWKDMVVAEIGELPPEFNYVSAHAHVSIGLSPCGKTMTRTYDIDISGEIKL
jgi:hypothetical protein